jgi:hypothetical protein
MTINKSSKANLEEKKKIEKRKKKREFETQDNARSPSITGRL